MHLPRLAALILAATLAVFPVLGTVAQNDQTPTPAPRANPNSPLGQKKPTNERIDLAAIALDGTDVGADYSLSFESYISADQLPAVLFGGSIPSSQVKATGIQWYYESDYQTADGVTQIRCYVEQYTNVSSVTKGFNLFENEDLFSQPGSTSKDSAGLGVGDEPSEVTTTAVKASGSTPASTTLDATFRVDRLLMGVAIDTTATTPPDKKTLTDLATRLQQRAQAVLDGEDLPDIDTTLPSHLLDFGNSFNVDEGYVSFTDAFGPSAPTGVDATFRSGYVRTVALGQSSNAQKIPFPLVTVGVSAFSTESSGLAILSNAITSSPPYKDIARVETDPIPGTSASVALKFADPFTNGNVNSFRFFLLIGDDLVTIDVMGADTVDNAQKAALALAKQEVGCFGDGATCGTAQLPAGFASPKG